MNISKFVRPVIQLCFFLFFILTSISLESFLPIIILTILLGNFFCGWICPFGTIQELFRRIGDGIGIKRRKMPEIHYLRYITLALILIPTLSFLESVVSNDPRMNFNIVLSFQTISTTALIVILFFITLSLFFDRPFCNSFCFMGAKLGLMSIIRPVSINRNDSCVNCKKCDNICPMNVSISKNRKVRSPQCINCFKCLDICPVSNTLSYGLKGKSNKFYSIAFLVVITALIPISLLFSDTYSTLKSSNLDIGKPNSNITIESDQNTKDAIYSDGTYTGIGSGFKGDVNVEITIKDNTITNVKVLYHNDDYNWFIRAEDRIIQNIIETQSTDVDTVSGATYSSRGIIEGAISALESAK